MKGDPRHPDVVAVWPAMTRDGGETWHLGREAVGEENARWTFTGSVVTGNRTYVHPFLVRYPWSFRAAWFDNGVQSEIMTNVVIEFLSDLQPGKKSNVMLGYKGAAMPNGDLIITAHGRFAGARRLSVLALQSTNNGASFQYLSTIATDENAPWAKKWEVGFEGSGESSIVRLANGDLLCVMRVGAKQFTRFQAATEAVRMLQARSRDGGRTWRHTCLPMEGVSPRLIQMSNGILVLAFGRPGNSLAFSSNGGRVWAREIAITPADVKTSGYIDVMEVSPGRLLVVYDAHDTDKRGFWLWEPRDIANGVFGVFVDVKRLVPGRGAK